MLELPSLGLLCDKVVVEKKVRTEMKSKASHRALFFRSYSSCSPSLTCENFRLLSLGLEVYMNKKLLLGLSVFALGVVLSACEPEEVEIEEDSYIPGAVHEYVLSPSTNLHG